MVVGPFYQSFLDHTQPRTPAWGHQRPGLEETERRAFAEEIKRRSKEPKGPAMRLSGLGLTEPQKAVVDAAVKTYFTEPAQIAQRKLLDVASDEYKALDPDGVLRKEGIRIYDLDGLLS